MQLLVTVTLDPVANKHRVRVEPMDRDKVSALHYKVAAEALSMSAETMMLREEEEKEKNNGEA